MKIRTMLRYSFVMGALLMLYACGGGGGSSAPAPTVVKGVAQAGVFNGATVTIFGYDASGALVQLPTTPATVLTDSTGNYQADIGSYKGAIVVKVHGTYHDEATNQDVTGADLQSAVPSASGTVSVPVTALTDLAVRNALATGNGSIKDNIASANQGISALFGFDIIATTPVAPTTAALGATGVTDSQKKYTTALAALSQYTANISSTPAAPTASDLQSALTQISAGITITATTTQVTSPQVALSLQQSAAQIATNVNTQAAVTAAGTSAQSTLTSLSTVGDAAGSKILAIKVKTTGTSSTPIFGAKATITLPSGATVRTDSTGATLSGAVVASGAAVGANTIVLAAVKLNVLTIGPDTTQDIGIGEFATIYCDVPSTNTLTTADFPVTGSIATDLSPTKQGVTVAWPMAVFF